MKKALALLVSFILLTGCDLSKLNNTPIKQVELFFNKYQSLDSAVTNDLEQLVNENESFNNLQREKYQDIMEKHYQDLKYVIKDEEVDGDEAKVIVEIEVNDYSLVLAQSETYLSDNPEEFQDETGNYDRSKFIDYQLDKLKENKEKVKYTLTVTLIKKDNKWQLNKLTKADYDKINGIYIY